MVLPEGSTLFHQEASERYFTIFVCLFICGSLALNNSPERNVFYQVRALEGAWERALDGDFEATSGKNKENVKPVQQRQEIESTEPRKSWIETAAAAGVVTMVQANGENAVEENPNEDVKKMQKRRPQSNIVVNHQK